jgi:hypothetical protein
MVCAALQVRQTKTALVLETGCSATDHYSYLVSCDAIGDSMINVDAYEFQFCDGAGTLWSKVEPYLVVVPCVMAAAWFLMLFWIKQLYAEFG